MNSLLWNIYLYIIIFLSLLYFIFLSNSELILIFPKDQNHGWYGIYIELEPLVASQLSFPNVFAKHFFDGSSLFYSRLYYDHLVKFIKRTKEMRQSFINILCDKPNLPTFINKLTVICLSCLMKGHFKFNIG